MKLKISQQKGNTETRKEKSLMHLILRSILVMKVSHFKEVISRPCLPVRLLVIHLLHPNVIVGIFFFIAKHRNPYAFLEFSFLPVFAYLSTLASSGIIFSIIRGCSVTAGISVFFLSFVHTTIFMVHSIIIGIIERKPSLYKGLPIFTFTYPRRIISIWNATVGNMFPFFKLKYSYPYRFVYLFYLIVVLDMLLLVTNLAYLR